MTGTPGRARGFTAAIAAALLAAALTIGTCLGPAVWAARSTTGQQPAADQGVLAGQLAAAVTQAGTTQGRYTALLAVMRAAGIGVYSSRTGQPIVRGSERSIKDFYTFDFELTIVAGALGRSQTSSVADIATILTGVGIHPAGGSVDPAALRWVLRAGVALAAAHPADPHALIPLLVRALGLRHTPSYDLRADVPEEALRFDPLQTFLIAADFLVPIVQSLPAHAGQGARALLTAPVGEAAAGPPTWRLQALRQPGPAARRGAASGGACTTITDLMEAINKALGANDPALSRYTSWQMKGWKALAKDAGIAAGETLATAIARLQDYAQAADAATYIVNALHDILMSYSVDVHRLDSVLKTHYGPPGHHGAPPEAGQELRFRIEVVMRDKLQGDQDLVNCAKLLGFDIKFPPQGPMAGIIVIWEHADELRQYGTLDLPANWQRFCPRAGLACASTGQDGIATLVFRPKDEQFPGKGIVTIEHGSVTGTALYQLPGGHIPGLVGQVLTPKYDVIGWDVGRHAPLGFKFSHLKLTLDWNPSACANAPCVWGRPMGTGGCATPSSCDTIVKEHWDIDLSGRVCGESPYTGYDIAQNQDTGLWDVTEDAVVTTTYAKRGPVTRTAHDSYPWQIAAGSGAITEGYRDVAGADHASLGAPPYPHSANLDPQHAHVTAVLRVDAPTAAVQTMDIRYDLTLDEPSAYTPGRQGVVVPVEDDNSCPLPPLHSASPAS